MASYQRLCITSCTIFFCLLSLSSSQKVTLSLYYEALCPFCAEFIVNRLPKIFETGLISSIDLQLVPWGNAAIRPDGTILCHVLDSSCYVSLALYIIELGHSIWLLLCFQHGEAECALNAIHACAINAYPDVVSLLNGKSYQNLLAVRLPYRGFDC